MGRISQLFKKKRRGEMGANGLKASQAIGGRRSGAGSIERKLTAWGGSQLKLARLTESSGACSIGAAIKSVRQSQGEGLDGWPVLCDLCAPCSGQSAMSIWPMSIWL